MLSVFIDVVKCKLVNLNVRILILPAALLNSSRRSAEDANVADIARANQFCAFRAKGRIAKATSGSGSGCLGIIRD